MERGDTGLGRDAYGPPRRERDRLGYGPESYPSDDGYPAAAEEDDAAGPGRAVDAEEDDYGQLLRRPGEMPPRQQRLRQPGRPHPGQPGRFPPGAVPPGAVPPNGVPGHGGGPGNGCPTLWAGRTSEPGQAARRVPRWRHAPRANAARGYPDGGMSHRPMPHGGYPDGGMPHGPMPHGGPPNGVPHGAPVNGAPPHSAPPHSGPPNAGAPHGGIPNGGSRTAGPCLMAGRYPADSPGCRTGAGYRRARTDFTDRLGLARQAVHQGGTTGLVLPRRTRTPTVGAARRQHRGQAHRGRWSRKTGRRSGSRGSAAPRRSRGTWGTWGTWVSAAARAPARRAAL